MHYYNGNWYGGGSGAFIAFHIIGCLLFLALIIIVVRYCFFGAHKHYHNGRGTDTAIDIAKQRYAKGEISKEEYDKILKDIK